MVLESLLYLQISTYLPSAFSNSACPKSVYTLYCKHGIMQGALRSSQPSTEGIACHTPTTPFGRAAWSSRSKLSVTRTWRSHLAPRRPTPCTKSFWVAGKIQLLWSDIVGRSLIRYYGDTNRFFTREGSRDHLQKRRLNLMLWTTSQSEEISIQSTKTE